MRYAILSDIHSNLEALTAVLNSFATQHVDRYLCLGDVVGYGANPEACLDLLRRCEAASVCGNHDWACIGRFELNWFNDAAKRALLWTRDQLGFSDLDYLRRLPPVLTEELLTCVHGTLRHPERFEYLADVAQAVDVANACRTLCCFVGHTHVPLVVEYDRRQERVLRVLTAPSELAEVRLSNDPAQLRYVLNPGSVGQPRDGDPRASCAMLDTTAMAYSIQRISYDVATAQQKIRQAGLPNFLAERLAIGR